MKVLPYPVQSILVIIHLAVKVYKTWLWRLIWHAVLTVWGGRHACGYPFS